MSATINEEVTSDLAEVTSTSTASLLSPVEVMQKRRLEHCLLTMEGLAGGEAGVRLAWGEVTALSLHGHSSPPQVVPLWFLSEARGTTGSRKRVLPQVDGHCCHCRTVFL